MTYNGMGGEMLTVRQVYEAFDTLPAQVRAVLRNTKLPWNPIMFQQLLHQGHDVATVVRVIREMDSHYMRVETAKEYGVSHPEA